MTNKLFFLDEQTRCLDHCSSLYSPVPLFTFIAPCFKPEKGIIPRAVFVSLSRGGYPRHPHRQRQIGGDIRNAETCDSAAHLRTSRSSGEGSLQEVRGRSPTSVP